MSRLSKVLEMGELNFDEIHNFVDTDLMKPRSFSALHTSSVFWSVFPHHEGKILQIYELLLLKSSQATDSYYGIRFKHYNALYNFR